MNLQKNNLRAGDGWGSGAIPNHGGDKVTLENKKIGFCITGSFCTFEKAFNAAEKLVLQGAQVIPIMSFNAYKLDTRFGKGDENLKRFENICGREAICTIEAAEPIGPKNMCDIMIVAPCTANTIAKLALGITDTPVTMAVKSHLRNLRPVVITVSTNDALAGCAKNIGALQNYRNFYFVPYKQDSYLKKPNSIVADFELITPTLENALDGKQFQPVII